MIYVRLNQRLFEMFLFILFQPPSSGRPPKIINESLVSLLIQLHHKQSPDVPYRPNFDNVNTSRLGDGAHFIRILLDKMGHYDVATRDHITTILRNSNTCGSSDSYSHKDEHHEELTQEQLLLQARKERARKSALRQQKVMEAFKKKQNKFFQGNRDAALAVDIEQQQQRSSSRASIGQMSDDSEDITTATRDFTLLEEEEDDSQQSQTLRPNRDGVALLQRISCGICSQEKDEPLGLAALLLVSTISQNILKRIVSSTLADNYSKLTHAFFFKSTNLHCTKILHREPTGLQILASRAIYRSYV